MRRLPDRRKHSARIGLVLVGALAIAWLGAATALSQIDDIQAQIDALNDKYEAMPSPSSAEEALQRGWAYEQEFAQIGGEAPNGVNELTPADYEDNAIPEGIQEAVEDVAGFDLTNTWSG
ncbi:MAG: hypothetical protein ACREXY_24420, partial [Gammaproteobacteria bacterium]